MKKLISLTILLFFVACSNTSTTFLGDSTGSSSKVSPEKIKVYLSKEDITKQWKKIALITVKGDFDLCSKERILKKFKEKASEIGANAIIIVNIEEPSAIAKAANRFLATPADRVGEAIAIWIYE